MGINPFVAASDQARIVGVVDPDANTTGDLDTAWVDAAFYDTFMAVIMAGDLGSSATLDARLRQATSDAGAGAKNITGKAITQLTQAGTDSNKQAVINCRTSDLDTNNGYRYVSLQVSVGTATSDSAAVLLGFLSRYGAGADLASVDEIVT